MKILYVANYFGVLQNNLQKALNDRHIEMRGFYYGIRAKSTGSEIPKYAKFFSINSKLAHGPVLYLSSLRKIAGLCQNMAAETKWDLLMGHMLFCDGIICNLVYQKFHIPYVVCVRNTDINLWFLWKLPWIRKRGLEAALNAKRIIFINRPYCREYLQKIPLKYRKQIREKMLVIPNGIDDFWFKNKIEGEKKRGDGKLHLISVGRVEKNKNQQIMPQVLKKLEEFGVDAEYVNVGGIVDRNIANKLSLNGNVRLIGDIPKEELIQYYRMADIFVLPSLKETFGLVYAEAMTQGLPLIYTIDQGFDGQYRDGVVGYHVNPCDAEDIALKICSIIKNYDSISAECIKRSDNYSWDRVSGLYADIYENI